MAGATTVGNGNDGALGAATFGAAGGETPGASGAVAGPFPSTVAVTLFSARACCFAASAFFWSSAALI